MDIFLDLDCTLCDLDRVVVEWIRLTYDSNFTLDRLETYSCVHKYDGIMNVFLNTSLYDNNIIKPFIGSYNFVYCLKDYHKSVTVISDCMGNEKLAIAKKNYVLRNFGIENFIASNGNKSEFLNERSVLIDDWPGHIDKHISDNNGYGILFNYLDRAKWSTRENSINNDHSKFNYCTLYTEAIIKLIDIKRRFYGET